MFNRLQFGLAKAIGYAICEPQVRLGRRRHDGACDRCDEPIGKYAGEKLQFPLDDLSPEATSSRDKLRAMVHAEYVRICLKCSVDADQSEDGDHDV